MMGIVARAMHELGHRSAHATVGTRGNGAMRAGETTTAARNDCWKWLFAAVRIDSTNRQVS